MAKLTCSPFALCDKRKRKRIPARPLEKKKVLQSTVSGNRGLHTPSQHCTQPTETNTSTLYLILTSCISVSPAHACIPRQSNAPRYAPPKRKSPRPLPSHKHSGRKSQIARFRVKAEWIQPPEWLRGHLLGVGSASGSTCRFVVLWWLFKVARVFVLAPSF